MYRGNAKETYVEVLCFRQFYRHFVFVEVGEGNRNKRVEKYFEVSAVVDVGIQKNSFGEKVDIKIQLFGISEQLKDI